MFGLCASPSGEEVQPVTDMFYGASAGSVRNPFGHSCTVTRSVGSLRTVIKPGA
jgi:hypothetical protein